MKHFGRILSVFASIFFGSTIGCSHQTEHPANMAAAPALAEGATAVRLQATIYELRVPPAAIGTLDAATLAKADFAKPLPEIGEARALYRVDQRVSLAGDRIMVGSDEPTVTNTRMTDRGQRINSVQYSSVGAIVEFKAERAGPRELRVTSTIEMSTRTESPVKIADAVSSPVTRKAMLSLKGPVEVGEPSVLISADAASLDKDGKAVVYVARLVVGA